MLTALGQIPPVDRALLRFLRAPVDETQALNDAVSRAAAELGPLALSTSLLTRLRSAGPEGVAEFPSLLAQLHGLDLDLLADTASRIAFWINLANALVLHAARAFRVKMSVRERPGFFRASAYRIGGELFSLEAIEHGILRGNRPSLPSLPLPFAAGDRRLRHVILPLEPRIHFALNCATRSCPLVRVYEPDRLAEQLDEAAFAFIRGGAVLWDAEARVAVLSPIFAFYLDDFGDRTALAGLIARYLAGVNVEEDRLVVTAIQEGRLRYDDYDWSLPDGLGRGLAAADGS